MALDKTQQKFLQALANSRKPVVRMGQNGLSANLLAELEVALKAHELVKVKMAGADRAQREALLAKLVCESGAECVQQIGHTATLFRRNRKKPLIDLPQRKA